MNPEIFQDPQKFLWPYVYAKEAQKQLEEKQIEVEENFAVMQAVLGWLIDNPWVFLFFIQREIHRLDVPINGVAKAEIDRYKTDAEKLKTQFEADLKKQLEKKDEENKIQLNEAILAIWSNLKDKLVCPAEQVLVNKDGDLVFEGLFNPDQSPVQHNLPDRDGKDSLLDFLKKNVFNVNAAIVDISKLSNVCPPKVTEAPLESDMLEQPSAEKKAKRQSR